MQRAWNIYVLQRIHGTGYKMEWMKGEDGIERLYFYRDGKWCKYQINERLIPKGWKEEEE